MMFRKGFIHRCLAVAALAAASLSAGAQTNRGSLSGNVLDTTGAVIPNAQVTATNIQNGTVYKTVSSGAGTFQIQQMSLGSYTVNVVATGFSSSTQNGVLIQVAQVTALDVKLAAGEATTTVNVDASGTTLETESSDIGTVIMAKQVIDLPLSLGGQKGARAPEAFVFLTPGTVAYGSGSGNAGPSFFSKTSGGQNFATEVILDGAST
ncbi:MAG: carboxypeptidase-like regulatory domain-containing protein, partial [Acidobacteriota bacterium]|nr:carboxypeptidase-like regulatory domain-containing protein [Acidobacteriota bacterium]